MTESRAVQQWAVELPLPGRTGQIPVVAGRPIHGFWSFIAPHFSDVLLPPLRRLDGSAVDFQWTQPVSVRRPEPTELAAIRRRLTQGLQELSDAAEECSESEERIASGSRRTLMLAVAQTMAAVVAALVRLSDARLSAYLCRTTAGTRLHSWGSQEPGHPRRIDAAPSSPHGTEPGPEVAASPSQLQAPEARKPRVTPLKRSRGQRPWLWGIAWFGAGGLLLAILGSVFLRDGPPSDRVDPSQVAASPQEPFADQRPNELSPTNARVQPEPLARPREVGHSLGSPGGNMAVVAPPVLRIGGEREPPDQEVFASRRAAMALASSGSSLPGGASSAGAAGSSHTAGQHSALAGGGGESHGAAAPPTAAGQPVEASTLALPSEAPPGTEPAKPPRPSHSSTAPEAAAVSPGDPTPATTDKRGPPNDSEPEQPDAHPSPAAVGADASFTDSSPDGATSPAPNERDRRPDTKIASGESTPNPNEPAGSRVDPTGFGTTGDSHEGPLPGRPADAPATRPSETEEPAGSADPVVIPFHRSPEPSVAPIGTDSRPVRAEFRQTPWTARLAVDSVLPTQPVPARLGSPVDALHRVTWNTRHAQRPAAFDAAESRSGIVIALRPEQPIDPTSLTWSESGESLPNLRTTRRTGVLDATWEGVISSLELPLTLASRGQTLVSIVPGDDAALTATWTDAISLNLHLEIALPELEPAVHQRLRWELTLDGRSITPIVTPSVDPPSSIRVTAPCPVQTATAGGRFVVMLVDPGSGWALRSELTVTPGVSVKD